MKVKWILRSTALFLAAMIMLMGSGFTLSRMTCFHSGNVKVALTRQENCCKSQKNTSAVRAVCCSVYNQDIVLHNFFQSIHKHNLKNDQCIILPGNFFLPALTGRDGSSFNPN